MSRMNTKVQIIWYYMKLYIYVYEYAYIVNIILPNSTGFKEVLNKSIYIFLNGVVMRKKR